MAYDDRRGSNTFLAAILGAAVGAAAVAFGNKDTREKMQRMYDDFKNKSNDELGKARDKIEKVTTEGKKELAEKLDKTSRRLRTT